MWRNWFTRTIQNRMDFVHVGSTPTTPTNKLKEVKLKNSSLDEKRKEVNKWALIWIGLISISLTGIFLFITLTEKKTDLLFGLPWWILAPAIVCIILAIPLLKKTREYEKLKESQKAHS